MIEIINPNIVLCSETHVTENVGDAEIAIVGYNHVRCDSHSRHTGGVLIYIHKSVDFKLIYNRSFNNNMWCIVIKTIKSTYNWQIGLLYHSPNTSDAEFIRYIEEVLEECFSETNNNVFVGDFNINLNYQSTYANQITSTFATLDMVQMIDFNTRITETAQTKIDLLFSNNNEIIVRNLKKHKISDHETILFKLPSTKKYKMRIIETRKCWEIYSKENLINYLRNYDFNQLNNTNCDQTAKILNTTLSNIMSNLVYDKRVYIKLMNKWYDSELSDLNKLKYVLLKNAERTNDWNEYYDLKSYYKRLIKLKKKHYLENKISMNHNNMKLMWKCLKDAINMNVNTARIKRIVINNVSIEDKYQIANALNKYFVDSIIDIRNNIENIVISEYTDDVDRRLFEFQMINTTDILKIASSFRNKYGGTKLVTEGVIKDSLDYLGYVYVGLINQSISEGVFPQFWKTSVVIPLEKVKGTIKPDEIRPINTLPCDEKIIETVVKDQLSHYLDLHKIIIPEQSGFRSKHSCETALNLVIAEWKESLSNREVTVSVFLDLKRAFETVDRDILLKKLYIIGVRNLPLKWFKSYLQGRKQKTLIDDAVSTELDVEIGLPQGSVLAAILFIIYINDIKKYIEHCKIRLFADDALLTISAPTLEEAVLKIQNDLNSIYRWLCHNKLKLNIDKTKYIIMRRRTFNLDTVDLKIANTSLQRVDSIKYLGVFIDDKLKFDEHSKYIEAKISKKIGFMFRTCKLISRKYKILVYRSIIEPHFIYCPTVLYTLNDSQISMLQKKQNKVMRFILRKRYDTHIQEMLDALNWLSVKQLVTYHTLKFIHSMKLGILPTYLNNRLRYNREFHDYQTRSRNDFHYPMIRNERDKRSIFYEGVREYNDLPNYLKICNNLMMFKKKLFMYCKNVMPIR